MIRMIRACSWIGHDKWHTYRPLAPPSLDKDKEAATQVSIEASTPQISLPTSSTSKFHFTTRDFADFNKGKSRVVDGIDIRGKKNIIQTQYRPLNFNCPDIGEDNSSTAARRRIISRQTPHSLLSFSILQNRSMESRVLTGATIRGLPFLSKPAARLAANCSFPPAHQPGKLADCRPLVWGRQQQQLRPTVLLESSPVAKRETVPPCSAAASSPAESSDSSGGDKVGFLEKYPALVTGFFFFMWYFLNVIFNILNKKIYNYFPYPYFVSVIHLFVGVIYCLASWIVGLPKRAPIDGNLLKLLIPVAVCHAIGHITSNVSFAAVAVSFTHTVKALEPFFNAAASQFILGQQIPWTLWLSLAPVVIGVSMASLTELSFNWTGFISAMISNISFTYRSIYSKKAMTDMDSTNLYAYISIIALIVCIPPAVIFEGPQLLKHGFNDAIAKVGMTKFITDLFWVGMFYHLYNQLATNTLERVAPLTHAVGNVLKRVFVIGFSILVFGNKISLQTGIGTSIAIFGVAVYSLIKAKMEEEKRQMKAA